MSSVTPITQRSVAQACGVHPSTICLALGNSPSIPRATRLRIQAMAQKLGYQPNAAARNLAFLRTDRKEAGSLPLAWINQERDRDFWRVHPGARTGLEGAQRRAKELGYYIEEFWVHETGMRLARLVQIIRARGVEGVLFPVYRAFDPQLFQAPWDELSLVSFNDHRAARWLDVVCPDYYHNIDMVLRELERCGRRRIGFVLSPGLDATTDGLACCRFLRFQHELPPGERVPLGLLPEDPEARAVAFEVWYRAHRPEVIICHGADHGAWLETVGPETTVITLGAAAAGSQASVDVRAGEVGENAVECVADKIRRFDRGKGTNTRRHLIKGHWCDGVVLKESIAAVA
jgi:DNA-binding LacI/PurR family transcriptional regulator